MNEALVRTELRAFVREHGRLSATDDLSDNTPLLDERVLTSLHIPELLLLIEALRGSEVDVLDLQAGDFRDIDRIVTRFFR